MQEFQKGFNTAAVMRNTAILLHCLLQGMRTYDVDVNSASEENWKVKLSLAVSPEASFNGDSYEKTHNLCK